MRRVQLPALVLSIFSVAFAGGCASNEMDMQGMTGVPSLASILPSSGPTTGGIMLQIEGQNFEPGATVTIAGEVAMQVAVTSSTHINALLPAKPGTLGKVSVVVTNTSGQLGSRSDLFSYYASMFDVGSPLSFTTGMGPNFVASGDVYNKDKFCLQPSPKGGLDHTGTETEPACLQPSHRFPADSYFLGSQLGLHV